ncbi:hypothetical protein QBC36DRAFT_93245 [Triangularia setosa]|uniref:Uncharacterized protein n=1 Tax=Triangularia setosa TaxID=2587417 RepID=A0AAN6WBB6_9PEZI|nr:hypothetical protein QBC36DRAFT_93245 [Podospora setosa]
MNYYYSNKKKEIQIYKYTICTKATLLFFVFFLSLLIHCYNTQPHFCLPEENERAAMLPSGIKISKRNQRPSLNHLLVKNHSVLSPSCAMGPPVAPFPMHRRNSPGMALPLSKQQERTPMSAVAKRARSCHLPQQPPPQVPNLVLAFFSCVFPHAADNRSASSEDTRSVRNKNERPETCCELMDMKREICDKSPYTKGKLFFLQPRPLPQN